MQTFSSITQLAVCHDCETAYPVSDTLAHPDVAGKRLCSACRDEYSSCEDCGRVVHNEQTFGSDRDRTLCETCFYTAYCYCERCDYSYLRDEVYTCCDRVVCPDCYHEYHADHDGDDADIPTRRADERTDRFIAAQPGTVIASPRIFGVEIETYYPDRSALEAVVHRIDDALGVSLDGSLGSRGIEFQTPRLGGQAGEQFITTLCQHLCDHGFYIQRSCGLHVHLDGAGYTADEDYYRLRTLWQFYLVFEDVLLAFLPQSRRTNSYCKAMKQDFHLREIGLAATRTELEQLWYRVTNKRKLSGLKKNRYDQTRYSGVNLHSLFHAGHIEIRYHSGTISAPKILQWVNLHARIMRSGSSSIIGMSILRSDCWGFISTSARRSPRLARLCRRSSGLAR